MLQQGFGCRCFLAVGDNNGHSSSVEYQFVCLLLLSWFNMILAVEGGGVNYQHCHREGGWYLDWKEVALQDVNDTSR